VWGCITFLGLVSSIILFLRTRTAYSAANGQQVINTTAKFRVDRTP
jgi:hypothetical protein